MKYPASFSEDLKQLSAFYEWTPAEKIEIRKWFTDCEQTVHFLTVLASAHRAGYRQCAANGFIRLQAWCIDIGIGDPFGFSFDVAALDAYSA